MLLLMLFAVVAGAGTAITPCVLPVLPAVLSASALGGRRRPLGVVVGLASAFTVAIVALAQLVKGVGLAGSAARTAAIVVLIAFGLILLIPDVAARVQAPLSRLARFGPRSRGSGVWSGVGVGAALGFVCAPCAGPILAAVTSVSASGGASASVVAVALSYSLGLSAVMLLYAFGGRLVIERIRRTFRGHVVERALGVILIATGIAMAANLDVRFEEALASYDRALALQPNLPEALSNRGITLRELQRFEEALASCDCALALPPGRVAALGTSLGVNTGLLIWTVAAAFGIAAGFAGYFLYFGRRFFRVALVKQSHADPLMRVNEILIDRERLAILRDRIVKLAHF